MALVPYDPFRMLDAYWNEMDRHFRRGRSNEELSQLLYRVDVDETATQVLVAAEIPGIENKDDLHIELDENMLTIQGEIKRATGATSNEQRSVHQSERYYGRFTRTFTLPAMVKTDGAQASYKNGVLELVFLKDSRPAARTIDVNFH